MIKNSFDSHFILDIKAVLNNRNIIVEIYVNDNIYIERRDYKSIEQGKIKFVDITRVLKEDVPVYGVLQLLDLFNDRIEKIIVYSLIDEDLEVLEERIKKLADVNVNRSSNTLVICPCDCSRLSDKNI